MSTKMIQEIEGGVQFRIKVQPRSSKNQVCGIHGDAIKLKLTAPPVDGAANEACQRYLADLFGLAISRIQIISGQTLSLIHILALLPAANTVVPAPTKAGVLGITRTTLLPADKYFSIVAVEIPAIIEMTKCSLVQ